MRPDRSRCFHEVVVRDLREEEVVCHVAIRDVMVQIVDSPSEGSVHRLQSRGCEVEIRVVVRLRSHGDR